MPSSVSKISNMTRSRPYVSLLTKNVMNPSSLDGIYQHLLQASYGWGQQCDMCRPMWAIKSSVRRWEFRAFVARNHGAQQSISTKLAMSGKEISHHKRLPNDRGLDVGLGNNYLSSRRSDIDYFCQHLQWVVSLSDTVTSHAISTIVAQELLSFYYDMALMVNP